MYNTLKQISTDNDYVFLYARNDYQNLFNEIEEVNKPHIFLDPVQTSTTFDETGGDDVKTYSGSFMILLSSDIDVEDYDTRYQDYIKPVVTGATETIKNAIRCSSELEIQVWQSVEVINVMDYNFDGVIITYQLTESNG